MHQRPWSAVGRLQLPGLARCTAVMVAPHWAVTAAHCLGERRLGHVAPPSAIHLLLGYEDGRFTQHLVADAVHVAPEAAAAPEAHRGQDIALLHFPAAAPAFLPIGAPPAPGEPVQLGGYGQDRAERLAVDPACHVTGAGRDADGSPLLLHDCNGTRGSSGGALVVRSGETWRLVGVQVAGRADGAGGVAVPAASLARIGPAPD